MSKTEVLEEVLHILEKVRCRYSFPWTGCFDVFAKYENDTLAIKALENIDSIDKHDSDELKGISKFLTTSPLIIGKKSSREELMVSVIYERYGIPAVRPETLREYFRSNKKPIIYQKKGGYYVSINGESVEERRKERDYSLSRLAKKIGVTPRTVLNYRDNNMASLEKAEKLERVLGDVFKGIDIFDFNSESWGKNGAKEGPSKLNYITKRLRKIGFSALNFERAPFDVLARDEEDKLMIKEEKKMTKNKVIRTLLDLKTLAETTTFVITQSRKFDGYESIFSISRRDFNDINDKEDLKEIV